MLRISIRNTTKHTILDTYIPSDFYFHSYLSPRSSTQPIWPPWGFPQLWGSEAHPYPRSGSCLCTPLLWDKQVPWSFVVLCCTLHPLTQVLVRKHCTLVRLLTCYPCSKVFCAVSEISLQSSACCLILLMVAFHISVITVGQRPFWTVLSAPNLSQTNTQSLFPLSHFSICGCIVSVKGQECDHLHDIWIKVWERASPATDGKREVYQIQQCQ